MSPSELRRQLTAAFKNLGIREAWVVEVAARNAIVDDEGKITLPTYLGRRDIAAGGAKAWLEHYCPANAPADLTPDTSTDEMIGRAVSAGARRANFGARVADDGET